ncbi:TOLL-like receptor [Chamberlinius hualienensis]
MANKILIYISLIMCALLIIEWDFKSLEDRIKVKLDDCIFDCGTLLPKVTPDKILCTANCDHPTALINKKYSINNILSHYYFPYNINWLSMSSNNIFGFNTNYFCSIKRYRVNRLWLENNKLNDITKIGLGDINKCEDDKSKCKNTIVHLYFSGNPLKILKNNSFCHLKNLTKLNLSNCSLNSIEVDAFKFNGKLEELHLGNNQFTEIPILPYLDSLTVLSISNNLITSIKNEDFIIKYKKLRILILSGNSINHIEDNAFDQLSNLNELDLSDNQLTTISKTFQKLKAKSLKLEINLLKNLNMMDFSRTLTKIYANGNLLTKIPANFSDSKLKIIDLSNNKIKLTEKIQLPKMIEQIKFNGNKMNYFSVQFMNKTNKVKVISIENNQLQFVPYNEFQAHIYNLNGNPLVCSCENSWLFNTPNEINSIHGKPCSTINKFNPRHQSILNENMLCESNFNDSNRCRIKHSKEPDFQCQFQCLNPCYCYTTSNFSLAIYYCSKRQLQSVPQWTNSGQLHKKSEVIIWLDGNNINLISNVSFIDYYNVIQLYLNNSCIEEIDHFTFNNMTKLILLDLSHNLLNVIEKNTFDKLVNLEILLLSNNKLRKLPDNSFDNLKSIQYLYLHDNKLVNYPVWNLEKLPSIKKLTISNNTWSCNCGIVTQMHHLLKIKLILITNSKQIECFDGNKTFPLTYYYISKCLLTIKNCSINCKISKYKYQKYGISINVNCNNSTKFVYAKHDIDDIIKSNCLYNYSSINAIELTNSNIVQLKTNFFCPIDFLNSKYLRLINNQLNDSTKLGFGNLNKCSSMSKCNLQTLETLNLKGNPLKILKNNSFCHLKMLKNLDLSNCSLETIEADAFFNLEKVKILKLDDNRLKQIPISFHLKSLDTLNMTNNAITSIDNIRHYPMLYLIDFSYNKIRMIELNLFDEFKHSNISLYVDHNQITNVSLSDVIKSKIKILDLSYNQLTEIDFHSIPPNLAYLLLKGNLFTKLTILHYFNDLTYIDLSRNKIETVLAINLPEYLVLLDLSHNLIKQISISKANWRHLDQINLENNSISILHETDILANRYQLLDNPIACQCENSWLFKNKLQDLTGKPCKIINKYNINNQTILSDNMLCESNYNSSNRCLTKHLETFKFQCQFECPYPCYCYTTNDFSIAHYYCSNRQLQLVPQWVKNSQLNPRSKVIVWLNGNNFNKIKNENFTDYDNVKQLYLSNSHISSIDYLTFAKMTKLKILDLSYNELTTIADDTFKRQTNLQKIILSHNQIEYLPDNCFNYTKAHRLIHLHNNKLTNYSSIEYLSSRTLLKDLTIHNNNWTCNCSFIIEFQNFLIQNYYRFKNPNEIYCVDEDGTLANSPVIQYNTSHCTDQPTTIQQTIIDNTWAIVIGVIAPSCVFAIVYGVVHCIKSRVSAKRVKRIERAYRLMKNAGTPIETNGKVFDVFISYSNDDSNFVVTDILPKLEDINDPYHVCVHERNFLGGGSIEDTIIEAIKKSTRIIVILTKNYMKSDWCMYEFIIAHSVMIEDQCPRVVLIIKDNLPPDINPNLQIYLSTNTYIEWTDKKFWQRLHFALSSNKLPIEQTLQPMNFLMSTRFIMPQTDNNIV